MECCSAEFSARRFYGGGRNIKGGKFRNFKSVNTMSRVDTEGGESFCSFPELFQDSGTKGEKNKIQGAPVNSGILLTSIF